jgi:hypothetical protein
MDAVHTELMAQDIGQKTTRLDLDLARFPVQRQVDLHAVAPLSEP